MAIVPLVAVVAIAVWAGIHTHRLAHSTLDRIEALSDSGRQGQQV